LQVQLADKVWLPAEFGDGSVITTEMLQVLRREYGFYPVYNCPLCRCEVTQRPCEVRQMNDLINLITLSFEGIVEVEASGFQDDWTSLFVE
jgi:hypothetical protein